MVKLIKLSASKDMVVISLHTPIKVMANRFYISSIKRTLLQHQDVSIIFAKWMF